MVKKKEQKALDYFESSAITAYMYNSFVNNFFSW